jgi:predicted DNA-binding transcriptional regulator AlpA
VSDRSKNVTSSLERRPYLNTPQAAHYLGMSARKLEKMRGKGAGPRYRRHGRLVFYHIDDLEAWSLSTSVAGVAHG